MNKNEDILDQLLKSSLAGLEGDVSPDAWDAISGRLDQLEKKRRPVYWWLAGLLVVGLSIGIMSLWLNNKPTTETLTKPAKVEEVQVNTLENKDLAEPNIAQVESLKDKEAARIEENLMPKNVYQPQRINSVEQVQQTEYNSPIFNIIRLNIRELTSLSNFSLANPDESIFIASEMGAYDFYNIPTNSKGMRKGQLTPMNEGSWEFGLSASPALASRLVKSNNAFSGLLNRNYNGATKGAENTGISYQFGLNAHRYFSEHLYLATGLQYDQIGESVNYDYTIKEFPVVDFNEKKIEYSPWNPAQWEHKQYNGHNTYNFIEIPLKLGIVVPVSNQKFKLKTELGLQYMLLVGASGKKVDPTYIELIDLKPANGYSRNNFGGMISSGLYKELSKNVEWGISPYYQLSFTSMRDKQSPLKDKPFSYGVNLQLTYKLLNNSK